MGNRNSLSGGHGGGPDVDGVDGLMPSKSSNAVFKRGGGTLSPGSCSTAICGCEGQEADLGLYTGGRLRL